MLPTAAVVYETETGQAAQRLDISGQFTAVLRHEQLGGLMQVAGARVITQSLPQLEHRLLVRRRQGRHVRECADEALKIGDDGVHLGLLQHHLAEPYVVRPTVVPPWQAALVSLEPVEQPCHPIRHGTLFLISDMVLNGQGLCTKGQTCSRRCGQESVLCWTSLRRVQGEGVSAA